MQVKVYLDANVLISLLEAEESQTLQVRRFLELVERQLATAVTSEISLAEVLVKPFRSGDTRLLKAYEALFTAGSLVGLVKHEQGLWLAVATYRALHGLKLADAVHVAVAIESRCDLLITADKRITSLERIKVMRPDDAEFAAWLDALT